MSGKEHLGASSLITAVQTPPMEEEKLLGTQIQESLWAKTRSFQSLLLVVYNLSCDERRQEERSRAEEGRGRKEDRREAEIGIVGRIPSQGRKKTQSSGEGPREMGDSGQQLDPLPEEAHVCRTKQCLSRCR